MKKLLIVVCMIALFVLAPELGTQVAESAEPMRGDLTLTFDQSEQSVVGRTLTGRIHHPADSAATYQVRITKNAETVVLLDYSARRSFDWLPMEEGLYTVAISARSSGGTVIDRAEQQVNVLPVADNAAVVWPTAHPLVAFYTTPACASGESMRVLFKRPNQARWMVTDLRPCDGSTSMSFLIAGMRANSDYQIRHQVVSDAGGVVGYGPLLTFRTRRIDPLQFPSGSVDLISQAMYPGWQALIHSRALGDTQNRVWATDLLGIPIWYYTDPEPEASPTLFRPAQGGGGYIVTDDIYNDVEDQILRQVDLLGNVVRETSVGALNLQLVGMGQNTITSIHHDATPMPNGHLAIIASTERPNTGQQGGESVILGDFVLVLDEEWQVAWAWDGFEHLDVTREAILGETCVSSGPGCPPLFSAPIANDWMHSNSVTPTPDDHLILSIRHQDWVVKINYAGGTGDGSVIWRLGPEGDFTIDSADPYPWNSHQHDASYISDNQVLLYDNGNTRCTIEPAPCNSRGQVYELDENTMEASLVLNADLEGYAFALGSAQRLGNGNYFFGSGSLPPTPPFNTKTDVVTPSGDIVYTLGIDNTAVYRSYRLPGLYFQSDWGVYYNAGTTNGLPYDLP